MTKRYSIAEARSNLAAIVHEVGRLKSIEITRRGEPVAVLISKHEYDRLNSKQLSFWDAYKAFVKEVDLAELKIDPTEVFGNWRDRSAGRDIDL